MDSLISVINKLQDVFNTIGSDEIQLPQIVVVGTQSSGKSSVLENIAGRSFLPRGTGIVTRTPLVLQLVHSPQEPGPHRRLDNGTLDVEEFGVFLHSNKVFTDFEEIRDEIESQTDRITGTNKGISEEVISLKLYSPAVVNLTLVDLPGLTKVPVGDQPEDIEAQIRNMVLKYIQNPNSIIMAVVTANTDMATNESLKLAKECDPKGDRTLAVVTKLDLMDAGTDATDILSGRVIPVKLGIIAVINRSQQDIINQKPLKEVLKAEKSFLREKYPGLSDFNGTRYLRKMLNNLLMKHIKTCLPDLKTRVQSMIGQRQARLKAYGDDVTDKNEALLKVITRLSAAFGASVTGSAANLRNKKLVGGARICYTFHETFKKDINDIDPLSGVTRTDMLTLMRNATGPRPALFIPELAFELLVKEQIERLREPSLRCADLVHEEMQRMVERSCSETEPFLKRFPVLRDTILGLVSRLLTTRMESVNSMIHSLIAMELSYINTRHPYFDRENSVACKAEPDGDDELERVYSGSMSLSEVKDCVVVENLLRSYFKTVQTSILDAVPKAIMHYLVNFVKDNVQSELITSLYRCQDTGELFQEAKHIAHERKENTNILKGLHQANIIINEICDHHLC